MLERLRRRKKLMMIMMMMMMTIKMFMLTKFLNKWLLEMKTKLGGKRSENKTKSKM